MLKADQNAFVQNTNINLVGIRQTEIAYFISFFTNFGTQCALIAGFIVNSLSQVQGKSAECSMFFVYLFWFAATISLMFSVNVLLSTVFIVVYGQGLALRGPVGSMVRAVEGMIAEQDQVVISYVSALVLFAVSTIGIFWIMMEQDGAVLCSIMTVIGLLMWYHFTLRIYNRFKWEKSNETRWEDDPNGDPLSPLHDYVTPDDPAGRFSRSSVSKDVSKPTVNNTARDSIYSQKNEEPSRNSLFASLSFSKPSGKTINAPAVTTTISKETDDIGSASSSSSMSGGLSMSQSHRPSHTTHNNVIRGSIHHSHSANNMEIESDSTVRPSTTMDNLASLDIFGGYLSVKFPSSSSSSSGMSNSWHRRYVVLNHSFLFYYDDRKTFEQHPENMAKKRPTDLEGYQLIFVNPGEDPPYLLRLHTLDEEDDRRDIEFQCDTTSEAQEWIEALSVAMEIAHNRRNKLLESFWGQKTTTPSLSIGHSSNKSSSNKSGNKSSGKSEGSVAIGNDVNKSVPRNSITRNTATEVTSSSTADSSVPPRYSITKNSVTTTAVATAVATTVATTSSAGDNPNNSSSSSNNNSNNNSSNTHGNKTSTEQPPTNESYLSKFSHQILKRK